MSSKQAAFSPTEVWKSVFSRAVWSRVTEAICAGSSAKSWPSSTAGLPSVSRAERVFFHWTLLHLGPDLPISLPPNVCPAQDALLPDVRGDRCVRLLSASIWTGPHVTASCVLLPRRRPSSSGPVIWANQGTEKMNDHCVSAMLMTHSPGWAANVWFT